MATLDPQLRSIIDAYFCALNTRDETAFAACLSEDISFFGSMAGVRIRGIDALRGMFQALGDKFPGLTQEPGRTFGFGPEVAVLVDLAVGDDHGQGVWVFRFEEGGRIERISALYDPRAFQLKRVRGETFLGLKLEEAVLASALEPAAQSAIDTYFSTFNEGDEEGHMQLFDPDVAFFGSMTRVESTGTSTVRGIFLAAQSAMGVRRLNPVRIYGRRHELAVLLTFSTEGSARPPVEGVWVFHINGKAQIDRLSTLWNPTFF